MLTLIVLLPLLGFLLNGVLATQLGGNRVGKPFVIAVGLTALVALPSFVNILAEAPPAAAAELLLASVEVEESASGAPLGRVMTRPCHLCLTTQPRAGF